jgi:hypothetical protein
MKSNFRIPKQITSDRSVALGAVRTMNVNRSMVEEGILFRTVYTELAMSGNHQIVINTPALVQVHLLPVVYAGSGVRFRLAQATAPVTMTGNLSLVNLNDNSALVASSILAVDPSPAPSLGTEVLDDHYDTLNPLDAETILKPSTSYVLQFDKPVATAPAFSVELTMYEITPD